MSFHLTSLLSWNLLDEKGMLRHSLSKVFKQTTFLYFFVYSLCPTDYIIFHVFGICESWVPSICSSTPELPKQCMKIDWINIWTVKKIFNPQILHIYFEWLNIPSFALYDRKGRTSGRACLSKTHFKNVCLSPRALNYISSLLSTLYTAGLLF